ncbi:hypothetical protein SVIOM74S_08847 [Streptomyces violarus]
MSAEVVVGAVGDAFELAPLTATELEAVLRYGLTQEAISGLDPESEPSAARVKELQQEAKADGVTTVFYETLVSDKTAKTLAKDAKLKTDVLDPLEGITDKSRGDDYFQVMEANLKALQAALGAK